MGSVAGEVMMSMDRLWAWGGACGSLIWGRLFPEAITLARALVVKSVYTAGCQSRSRGYGDYMWSSSELRDGRVLQYAARAVFCLHILGALIRWSLRTTIPENRKVLQQALGIL